MYVQYNTYESIARSARNTIIANSPPLSSFTIHHLLPADSERSVKLEEVNWVDLVFDPLVRPLHPVSCLFLFASAVSDMCNLPPVWADLINVPPVEQVLDSAAGSIIYAQCGTERST